jgi:toxin HigB-1
MRVTFKQGALARIYSELAFTGGYSPAVVKAYRGRIQVLRAAPQERAIQQLQSLRLRSQANGQHLMRVTDDLDLIVVFCDGEDGRVVVVEAIVENNNKDGSAT